MSNFERWILRKKNFWIHLFLFLITFYVYLLIYLIVLFKNLDYYKMTRKPEQYANEKNYRCVHSKIVGVTFNNDDGTSRQKYLKVLRQYDELRLIHYEYKPNEFAIGVFYNNKQLGNINAELYEELKDSVNNNRIISVIAEPTGENGKTYGCNITIIFKK